jgi:hypothetical protein
VLSSGYLGPEESLALLKALRSSPIYRSDQNSYLLYPDRPQLPFMDRNVIDPSLVESTAWIQEELRSGRTDFIDQDVEGRVHFNTSFRSARDLTAALMAHPEVATEDAETLLEVYEAAFRHRQFTGRSGSMFKYEGLGSIYWHMVSKLLLATAETITSAARAGAAPDTLDELLVHFDEIERGLGVHKTPASYGAFTTDPYSHTPGFIGVQQPGMTGQVKEDVISRFCELGVRVENGEVEFAPVLLRRDEFLDEPVNWTFASSGTLCSEAVEAGCLAFTVAGVPVFYRLAQSRSITVFEGDGDPMVIEGGRLGRALSESLFRREKRVRKIVVDIPEGMLR